MITDLDEVFSGSNARESFLVSLAVPVVQWSGGLPPVVTAVTPNPESFFLRPSRMVCAGWRIAHLGRKRPADAIIPNGAGGRCSVGVNQRVSAPAFPL